MSAPATTAAHDHGPDENKYQLYVQIAMLLAVLTGIEIVAIFFPFAKWIIVTSLVVLSAVKFLFVIFYFMHLRWDKPFCTILFFIGMVLGGGTLWVLILLFGAKDSFPLSSLP